MSYEDADMERRRVENQLQARPELKDTKPHSPPKDVPSNNMVRTLDGEVNRLKRKFGKKEKQKNLEKMPRQRLVELLKESEKKEKRESQRNLAFILRIANLRTELAKYIQNANFEEIEKRTIKQVLPDKVEPEKNKEEVK